AVEGGGAVVVGGGELARLQLGPAAVGDDPVLEAGGEGEDAVRVGDQRSVADAVCAGRRLARFLGVRGRKGVGGGGEGADAARQRDTGTGDRGFSGEVPAGERHGVSCDGGCAVEGGGPRVGATVPPVPERELNTALHHRALFHESVCARPRDSKIPHVREIGRRILRKQGQLARIGSKFVIHFRLP